MIRIARAPEPPGLPPERTTRLLAASTARAAGKKLTLKGYEFVKDDLFRMQHNKCCYCETILESAKYHDVEHYRPKATYWWLTWTWENLLFACFECNRTCKGDQFPLAHGCSPLVEEQPPPGDEVALLIDPTDATVDLLREIRFRRELGQRNERWIPIGLTDRGRETVRVCGLDRAGLLTRYTDHVQRSVRPKIAQFEAATRDAEPRDIHRAWNSLHRALLGPRCEFRALSHAALEVLVNPALRKRHGLELPPLA